MYLIRKLGFYLVAAWAAVTLNFLIPRALPGSPVDAMLAKLALRGPVSPETRESIELMLGADTQQSLPQEYLDYLFGLLRGDLGVSVTYFPEQVAPVIAQSLPWTLWLVGLSTLITFVLGVGIGMFAGWKRGTWLDALIPSTTVLQSIPYFWLALVFVYIFSVNLGWFPISRRLRRRSGPAGVRPPVHRQRHLLRHPAGADHRAVLDRRLADGHAQHDGDHPERGLRADGRGQGPAPNRTMITYAARNAMLPT